jgi:hypothetical protein
MSTADAGHEISFALLDTGLGYCSRCDDWHDLEALGIPAPNPLDNDGLPGHTAGARPRDGQVAGRRERSL